MPGDIVVDSFIKFMSRAEIEGAWQTVFRAHVQGLQTEVTITSSNFEGGSATGIRIAPGERLQFMNQCQSALAELDGDAAPGSGLKIDFSSRQVRT